MQDLIPLPDTMFPVDRDAANRENPDLFDLLWANPATMVLPVHNGKVLVTEVNDTRRQS